MAEDAHGTEADDRTEAPTPRRLERAREEGDAPLSREAVQLASLGGAALALAVLGPGTAGALAEAAQALLARGAHGATPTEAVAAVLVPALPLGLGVAAAAGLGALAATFLQTEFLVSGRGLAPRLGKLSPRAGLKRLVGRQALEELVRTLLKVAACGAALWWALGDPGAVIATLAVAPQEQAALLAGLAWRGLVAAILALALVAVADVAWVRFSYLRRLRMGRQELREETKESEGDPHLKARRLRLMRRRSRRRALAEVARATVVVTNPTHFAVALAYERGKDAAPRVVAKGADLLAARIRAEAERHGVPLVSNPPLARALFLVEEEAAIPPEHFAAVAEVIAFVWRLRAGRAG